MLLHIDTTKTSARAVFDYFSKKLVATTPDLEDQERVSNVLEYIEDADLRRWQLPNTKEFQTALRGERAKLNCITNPHVFDQAIRADGHSELSHEIGLELSQRSAAAGLRPIGAVVFMQRGILKICLRTTDYKTNTSEIAKVSLFIISSNLHDL
ncbi:hypothetical protein PR202_gb16327 [Eleusine coracana subsp. coracana]|uniref:Uncharacterized protein n=1 Tax=Eleusine coracana subsp. coracana TaxID=191504 RepID=A0AAV5EXX2_ELECO|nr:hypothetical protein PR202_gb16327 [Eleusine coracana subsp. coracana]